MRFFHSVRSFLGALIALTSLTASSQTINGTGSVTAGSGSLSYSYSTQTMNCEASKGTPATFKLTIFSNFVYTVNGVSTTLSGPGSGDTTDDWGFTRTGGTCISDPVEPAVFTTPSARITFTPVNQSGTAVVSNFITGYINPKYLVVGVTYAPPGPNSHVQYTTTNMLGTTTSASQTFGQGHTTTISLSRGFSVPGVLGGNITSTTSNAFTQSATTSQSLALTLQSSLSTQTSGTPDQYHPVDHNYDLIWLWLNPVSIFTFDPQNNTQVNWNGYGFDMADQPAMEIYPVYVGVLNGTWPPSASDTSRLSRSWATNQSFPSGQGAGLTQADYQSILQADPFANPSYTFSLASGSYPATSSDGRFTLSGGTNNAYQNFLYLQPAPGQSPLSQTYNNTYTTTSTLGQSAQTQTTVTYGVDVAFAGSSFLSSLNYNILHQDSYTTSTSTSSSISTSNSQADSLTIVGPACNATTVPCVPQYTGPPEFNVYQDNLYGTFVFIPQ